MSLKILKWLPAVAGAASFLTGLALKVQERPSTYDEFILGNGYILLVIGIQAIILNFAFNYLLNDGGEQVKR